MAEPWGEAEYIKEARRIAGEYLSGMGWSRSQKAMRFRAVTPAAQREEAEQRFRDIRQREEDIEWKFGQEVDRWRKSPDKNRKIVLEEIVKTLGKRADLGFFGRRIVNRLKKEII